MSQPNTIEETPITLSELKASLDKIQERDEELSFRAGKTVDHLNHLSLVKDEKRVTIQEQLDELGVPRIKAHHINKIIDLQPSTVKELNVILSGYTLTVNKDYQQKIIDVLTA